MTQHSCDSHSLTRTKVNPCTDSAPFVDLKMSFYHDALKQGCTGLVHAPVRCSQFRRRFKMMTDRIAVNIMQEPVQHCDTQLSTAMISVAHSDALLAMINMQETVARPSFQIDTQPYISVRSLIKMPMRGRITRYHLGHGCADVLKAHALHND